ncbi:helix-turn-helix domain-containing protein [Mucilaginibacter paludis]|uniref:Transcriptional regulator, AraC family n=1 Tax=Mucilaginibacter paludis DSM 18603 TaxID=714943 RepID=H1YBM4_9SPHI|nr:AraC family transcriptional regulator [Mucilaginibacter paludis]EHQ25095.1 transcriptional regulator, AraC family [Mucilaginibacter paludis DSM 18603]
MERPIKLGFNSQSIITTITGKIPEWCKYRIPYAETEQITIEEGTIVCQFHSHILFFMEVVEFKLHQDLEATYLVESPSLFLFLMLEGMITFHTPDGKLIAEAPGNTCYVTYNKKGEYKYRLPAGSYRLCYLCPRANWIIRHLKRYPRLKPFIESMEHSDELFGHMPACQMDNDMKQSMEQLFREEEVLGEDLEATLSKQTKIVIADYQRLLDAKFTQRPYRIKDFLEENYADSTLDNASIANQFHISEKTLITDFKEEFETTPHNFLIQVRMEHAKRLLSKEKMQVNEVYIHVGYKDLHSFSVQFTKYFKNPPSNYFKGRFLPFFWAF